MLIKFLGFILSIQLLTIPLVNASIENHYLREHHFGTNQKIEHGHHHHDHEHTHDYESQKDELVANVQNDIAHDGHSDDGHQHTLISDDYARIINSSDGISKLLISKLLFYFENKKTIDHNTQFVVKERMSYAYFVGYSPPPDQFRTLPLLN